MPKSDNKSVGFPAMFLNVRPKSFYHSGPLVSISAYTPSPVGTKQCSHGREPMDSVARKTGEPRRAEGAKGRKGERAKGEANARVPFVPSGIRVVFSMFHGLKPAHAHGYNLSPLRGYSNHIGDFAWLPKRVAFE